MDDLKNEERIASTDSNRLVLTNRRIIYRSKEEYKSIRLENITYMELSKRPMTAILYIVVVINILIPIFFGKDEDGLEDAFRTAGIILTFGLFAYYFFQKRNLMFATSGGTIQIKAGNMSNEECYRFIEFTENAINVLKSNGINPVLHT
ncbi:MAG: PH domain-containing protein [Mucilaginibacter sp.]